MTTTNLRKLKRLPPVELSYIAGFLDGDGSIYAQIVKRSDYRLKFQIRVSITFYQKTTRHWFLIQLKNQLQYGTLRKNPENGMSDYTIVGEEAVKHCLEALRPHLKIKKRQATLLLQIIEQSQKEEEPNAFLTRCKLVDQVSRLNDSKVSEQRKVTSETVRSLFLKLGDLSPDRVAT
jgi:hypothetical protein